MKSKHKKHKLPAEKKQKLRAINPSWWTSTDVGKLSIFERYVLMGIVFNADDHGRMPGHPATIRQMLFVFDDVILEHVEAAISNIESAGFITTYMHMEKAFIQIVNFDIRATPKVVDRSEYPSPFGWADVLPFKQNRVMPSGWQKIRLFVLERDGNKCVYCGGEATAADHIVAEIHGGKYTANNLVAACKWCNSSKRDRELYQWYSKMTFFSHDRLNYIESILASGEIAKEDYGHVE